MNRNAVATINHNEHKDVMLKNKCFRQSLNIIQSKDNRINKISLSCSDGKIYIQNNEYDELALGSEVIKENSYLNNYLKKAFLPSIFF